MGRHNRGSAVALIRTYFARLKTATKLTSLPFTARIGFAVLIVSQVDTISRVK